MAEHVRVAEDVARVRVLRHEAQRLLLAAAADQDGWMRPAERLRAVEQPAGVEGAPVERRFAAVLAAPHLPGDDQRLLELDEALAQRGKWKAERDRLLLKIRRENDRPL